MSHFRLVKSDDIHNGPVDYSTPVGSSDIYTCSLSVQDVANRRRPAGTKFISTSFKNKFWFNKFCAHTNTSPEIVNFAKGKSGKWYAEAVSF
jgi:hypothetical protein